MKTCTKCQVEQPLSEFPARNRAKGYVSPTCKSCNRDYKYRLRYGITQMDVRIMAANQNYSCAVCGRHESDSQGGLHVDHSHATGAVRQLLCSHCNLGIGHMLDNPELLRRAADYLERHA